MIPSTTQSQWYNLGLGSAEILKHESTRHPGKCKWLAGWERGFFSNSRHETQFPQLHSFRSYRLFGTLRLMTPLICERYLMFNGSGSYVVNIHTF